MEIRVVPTVLPSVQTCESLNYITFDQQIQDIALYWQRSLTSRSLRVQCWQIKPKKYLWYFAPSGLHWVCSVTYSPTQASLSASGKLVGALLREILNQEKSWAERNKKVPTEHVWKAFLGLVHSLGAEDLLLLLVQHLGIGLPLQNTSCTGYSYPKSLSQGPDVKAYVPSIAWWFAVIQNAFRTRHKVWYN